MPHWLVHPVSLNGFAEMDSTSTFHAAQSTTETHRESRPRESKGTESNGTATSGGLADHFAQLYGPIAAELLRVEKRFHQELQSPYESLVPVLRHGTQLGGKRLRPAMLLLTASAVGSIREDHLVLGVVIEMVHTATLIHDDVLDDADTRRHVPTVNAKWNNHTSILLGDYLFAQSFRLAATLPSTEACRWIGEAARLVCEGEMRQVLKRDVLDIDETTYIEMIQGKTAELCRVACQLGSHFADGSPEVTASLAEYGDSLGIAFQIADDYLDLWGSDERVGKTLGTDLQQGKITLPIIRLLQTADEARRNQILQLLAEPSRRRTETIMPWLDQSDAREYTRETALQYQRKAIAALGVLAESPAKASLKAIAEFAVNRRF
ncbi:Trans-hexaprenyltranstransferase [Rhodopirellula maiorica SM1]|uniref:Trans-hexaprenyltranstransferase n=1 Tax=Rhodopirellula maiorica SM1 TaxID=1265738 RepID=M5RA87_9BACT|nr:polyprenyl synthetase family protein [Rhodopirellula maiorica]EMI15971.1 Trans-hexaprenyltranstransferase [Rhodopirellula maiorica SM1]